MEVLLHLHRPRTRQDADDRAAFLALLAQEILVEKLARQLVEEWMADVLRIHTALLIPRHLERQRTEDVINVAAHLLDAPARPRPDLWRHEIEHGNAMKLRTP